jgi:cobyrinic acid a,c-diamide synthase
MEYTIPRVVFAGTNSGCGKTTVTCSVLQALVNRKMKVGAFKCGPDYIDPMFHSRVIGAKSSNLDLFLFQENTLKYLLSKNGAGCELNIIEGVMGFYDGMGMTTERGSTYDVARVTQSPVVLIVGTQGAALSVLAQIHGFLTFCPDSGICGVILNGCSAMMYQLLAEEITKRFGGRVRPMGYLPVLPEASLEGRHLGLVTAAEVENLREKLRILAEQAEGTIDIEGLIALAKSAPPIVCEPVALPRFTDPVRIAVARDKAFCFYYEDSLEALTEMGAELVPFSPLHDAALPPDIHGLYIGGGYPELYAEALSKNAAMRASVKSALEQRIPCIAECGGFMYLTESIGDAPMVGFLPGRSFDTAKLVRFGYVYLKAKEDTMLCRVGEGIRGHEFHYWDSEHLGSSFAASKPSGASWDCVFGSEQLYAGYPHFHFYSNPAFAVKFYETCLREKHRHDSQHQAHGH